MKAIDYADMTCIHRKVFTYPDMEDEGVLVQIYYKFNHAQNNILVADYSVHIIINGRVGANVADDPDMIDDDTYQQMFKAAYYELINNVILKK